MALLLVAALVGGFATFAILLPCGMLIALLGAPFGGSLLCLMAGLLLALLRTRAERGLEPASAMSTAVHMVRPKTR
jgi:hypothetical protein